MHFIINARFYTDGILLLGFYKIFQSSGVACGGFSVVGEDDCGISAVYDIIAVYIA